jgi:hypothetical protein
MAFVSSTIATRLASLKGWLMLIALGLVVWLGITLFARDVGPQTQGRASLPVAFCDEMQKASSPMTAHADSGRVMVSYSNENGACNRVSARQASALAGQTSKALRELGSLGLANPSDVVHVGALTYGDTLQFRSNSGRAIDAFGIKVGEHDQPFAVAQGAASISVFARAPHLSQAANHRVAAGFAFLAAGDSSLVDQAARRLGVGRFTPADSGLYDAWIMTQMGTRPVLAALEACRSGCSYNAQLDSELRRRHRDPAAMRAQFIRSVGAYSGSAQRLKQALTVA